MSTSSNPTTLTLPSEREIAMSRLFDAPRDLVFRAYTDPQAIPQWWGLSRMTTIVDKMDLRPGGPWRFVQRDADGNEDGFHGEFREIVPPERITWTFEWEGLPGHVLVETITFEARGNQTLVKTVSVFDSVEDRDGILASGMETGAAETWNRLDAYLARRA